MLSNQESCVINGGSTKNYLKLERGALEVLFIILRNNAGIKGLISINEVISCFKNFSLFSGLKPNLDKCEVAGIGILKGVKVAVFGMNCIDLTKETIKIFGIHFSYNSQVQNEQNYLNTVLKIEKVLKL